MTDDALTAWFFDTEAAGRLPTAPFFLHPWLELLDPPRFYARMKVNLRRPRPFLRSSMMKDLAALKAIMEAPGCRDPKPTDKRQV